MLLCLLSACRFKVSGVGPDGFATAGDGQVVTDGGDGPDLASPDLFPAPEGLLPGETGWPCGSAFECESGFCVDGYCCESSCDPLDPVNRCRACNVPGFLGRCALAFAGTDPHGQCAAEPESTCGQDGLCDGAGQCRRWNAGTACGPPSCISGTVTYAPACNGLGACLGGPSVSCAPYECASPTACGTSCQSASDCAGGAACMNGTCGKRANGQPCTDDAECGSAHCAQGVCCATACSAPCIACNLPGTVGTCAPVPAGADPLAHCEAESRASCGRDGSCDGQGGCRLWVAGTPCAGPTCAGNEVVSARTCDGSGTCLPGTTSSCGKYRCNPANGSCLTRCKSKTHCTGPAECRASDQTCQ